MIIFDSHVPKTRSDLGIPSEGPGQSVNYMEYLEDTPFYTIAMLMIHQFIGFPLYIATNLGGQRHFPSWCAASTSVLHVAMLNSVITGPVITIVSRLF